jgi:hypothetical protein
MNYNRYTLVAAGGTVTAAAFISGYEPVQIYSAAAVVLTGALSIDVSDIIPYAPFRVKWNADARVTGFPISIVGNTIAQEYLNQPGMFEGIHNGTAWELQYYPDFIVKPQANESVSVIQIPNAGGTKTLIPGVDSDYIVLEGIPTVLTSNYTVTAITVGVKDRSSFTIQIKAGTTIGANTMTVFGLTIAAIDALNGGVTVIATFYAATNTWLSYIVNRTITTSLFPSISALSLVGNATAADAPMTAIPSGGQGALWYQDAGILKSAKLIEDNFGGTLFPTKMTQVALSASAIANSQTSPIKILDGVVGKIHPLFKVFGNFTFNGVAYTTNLNANIFCPSAADKIMTKDGFWGFVANGIDQMFDFAPSASSTQYVVGENVFLGTQSSNPVAGDGSCKLTILHSTITP